MIDVFRQDGALRFKIGPHEVAVGESEAREMGELLRTEAIERIAAFEHAWARGPWRIEGARDDIDPKNPKRDRRSRVLLHHGDDKWHLLRAEAVVLGGLFRRA